MPENKNRKEKARERARHWYQRNKKRANASSKKYWNENRAKLLEAQRKRYAKNKSKIVLQQLAYRKENRDKISQQKKDWYQKNKMRLIPKQAAYNSNNPKHAARRAVSNALRDGKLKKKPCEECGSRKVQAHHPDYSKPLKVVWLCIKHHYARHRKYV